MSSSSKDEEVGYGRPPKRTRWKKGQSGNPDRRYPARKPSALELIDRLLLRPIEVLEKGEARRMPAVEVIVRELWRQELAGNRRALAVRLKYQAIAGENAQRGAEIVLVENDYTRALADELVSERADDE